MSNRLQRTRSDPPATGTPIPQNLRDTQSHSTPHFDFTLGSPPSLSGTAQSPSWFSQVLGSPTTGPDRRPSGNSGAAWRFSAVGKASYGGVSINRKASTDTAGGYTGFGSVLGSPIHPAGAKQAFQMGINPGMMDGIGSPAFNGFVPFGALSPTERVHFVDNAFSMPIEGKVEQPPSPPNEEDQNEVEDEAQAQKKGPTTAGGSE